MTSQGACVIDLLFVTPAPVVALLHIEDQRFQLHAQVIVLDSLLLKFIHQNSALRSKLVYAVTKQRQFC